VTPLLCLTSGVYYFTLASMTEIEQGKNLYARIAGSVRDDILSGALPPGDRLPSERELGDRFDASRVTVRRALRTLEEERLIVRRHGSGTYVSARPQRRIPVMIDYTGSMCDHAPSLDRCVVAWRYEPADAVTSEALRIGVGDEVLYAERIDSLGGEPVACDRGYLAAPFTQGLTDAHLARIDFVETWSKVGQFTIELCQQTVEAVEADADVACRLKLKRGKPVLRSTETYLASEEQPVGLFISFYHPAHICIASQHHWADTTSGRRVKP